MEIRKPSLDAWHLEAKTGFNAEKIGMILTHTGVVRQTPKALVRDGIDQARPVTGMLFSYDEALVQHAVDQVKDMDGIYFVKVWLNEGHLSPGEDLMMVMVGGDIRPRVISAMTFLLEKLKQECVTERELI